MSKFIYALLHGYTLNFNPSLSLIKMTLSVKRKATESPVDFDTGVDTSTSTSESKRSRYGIPNSPEAGSPQNPAQTSLFLNLPIELRMEIYDLLLVFRTRNGELSLESLAKNYKQAVPLNPDLAWIWYQQSIFPAILRTCKQIHNETLPILYGNNIFDLDGSAIDQIPRLKVNLLRHLIISPSRRSEATWWAALLDFLIEEAKDLRNLKVAFDTYCYDDYITRPLTHELGADVPFVRELTRVRQLEKLETLIIAGFYAKHWPAYLRQEIRNDIKIVFEAGILNPRSFSDENYQACMHEYQVEVLEEYQKGTENLIP